MGARPSESDWLKPDCFVSIRERSSAPLGVRRCRRPWIAVETVDSTPRLRGLLSRASALTPPLVALTKEVGYEAHA